MGLYEEGSKVLLSEKVKIFAEEQYRKLGTGIGREDHDMLILAATQLRRAEATGEILGRFLADFGPRGSG